MMNLLQQAVKAFVWIVLRMLYRVRVRNSHNIPREGAAVLIPNHVSFIDAALIAAHIRRPVRYAMHWRIYDRFKWLVGPLGAFPIASRDENTAVYDEAFRIIARTLDAGELVCIFPEGRITTDGKMGQFRNGIIKITARNPVPLVPVGLKNLWGSYFSKKKSGIFKLPDHFMAKIEMIVGAPIDPHSSLTEMEKSVGSLIGR